VPAAMWDLLELDQVHSWTKDAAPWNDHANLIRLWRTFRLLLREGTAISQRHLIIEVCAEAPERGPVEQVRELHRRLVLSSLAASDAILLGSDWEAQLGRFANDVGGHVALFPIAELRNLVDAADGLLGSRPRPVVAIRDERMRILATRVLQLRWPETVVVHEKVQQ
jgi:hypothetical protein